MVLSLLYLEKLNCGVCSKLGCVENVERVINWRSLVYKVELKGFNAIVVYPSVSIKAEKVKVHISGRAGVTRRLDTAGTKKSVDAWIVDI
jgi:hypothetical protein